MQKIKQYIYTGAISALLLVGIKVDAQDANTVPNQLEKYTTTHLNEKLFLHTDKSVYLSNEICWFKIYQVDAAFNLPLSLSSIAYIELLDAQDKPVIQEKVDLQSGNAAGSFSIPTKIATGNYTLRAYTNWMKNFNPEFFFRKNISIINTEKESGGYLTPTDQQEVKIALFPESGQLIYDMEQKVAFKFTNANGQGINASAFILNEKSDTLQKINTLKLGMGSFTFSPQEGHQYKVVMRLENGKMISENFPKIQSKGYALQVSNAGRLTEKIELNIISKNITASNAYLMVHARGVVKSFKKLSLDNSISHLSIPVSELSEGINCLTLFDENRIPVAERLYFKDVKESMGLTLTLNANQFTLRNKVSINLNAFLQTGKPTSSDLSMGVYKIDELQSVDASNIQNYFWLSSDLPGMVESPNSYFDETDPQRLLLLDHLMLTSGWRKFNWEDVFNDKQPAFKYLPEIAGKIITGTVIPANKNLPLNGITAYLSIPSKRTQFRSALSDQNGSLKFQFTDFYNDDQVIAQIEKNNASNYKIAIESPYIKTNSIANNSITPFNNDEKFQIGNYHRDMQVQNQFNQDLYNKFEVPIVDTTGFYHKADETYWMDDYSRFATLEEDFREYMQSVKLTKSGDNFSLTVYDKVQKRFFNNQPLILLDGYPINDLNKFMNYDPLKIRKMELVERMYFLGNQTYYGILNCTTYNGKMETFDLDPQAVVLDFKGLQQQRSFVAPEYASIAQVKSKQPDFRHLLYWSDHLSTDDKGKTELSFYTSDIPGKYVIVVQGMNKDGKLGYFEKTFEVKAK